MTPWASPAGVRPVAAIVLVLALAAACGGGLPTPSTTAPPPGSPSRTDPPSASTPPVPGETTSPTPTEIPGPPSARLVVAGQDGADGTLGTFSWDGLVSDSPWVVPSSGPRLAPGSRAVVDLFGLLPETWTVAWAPVTDGEAGEPRGEDGTGLPAVAVPARAGTWSLQVQARFGVGRSATWYWRVEVR